jgi:molybdopterin synthase catalytic subunit
MSSPEHHRDQLPPHLDPSNYPQTRTHPTLNIHLTLTYAALNPTVHINDISSPSAGANLLFLGTTRDNFDHRPVTTLSYTTYPILAFKTLMDIAENAIREHGLLGVSIAHRLGEVPVGECSIVVGVSAGHRGGAFRGGEEVLERCKERVEVWKREIFGDGGSEWRVNTERDRDGNLK